MLVGAQRLPTSSMPGVDAGGLGATGPARALYAQQMSTCMLLSVCCDTCGRDSACRVLRCGIQLRTLARNLWGCEGF
jgi:hypothetical protein